MLDPLKSILLFSLILNHHACFNIIFIIVFITDILLVFMLMVLKLISQAITYEHEGNWGKALEYYDLQVRSAPLLQMDYGSRSSPMQEAPPRLSISTLEEQMRQRKPYKGLIRSLQQIGCMHVLDLYCQGLTSRKRQFQHDQEFSELQVCYLSNYVK